MMPWAYILALFAGCAASWGLRSHRRPLQAVAILFLVSGGGFELLHGADLTYALMRDSRYEAARWIDAHVPDGERVQYSSPWPRLWMLPRTRTGTAWSQFWTPNKEIPQDEFVVLFLQEKYENEFAVPAWLYERLTNGSLGYEPAATFQTPTLFSHPLFFINPRIEIFVRRDIAQRIPPSKISTPFNLPQEEESRIRFTGIFDERGPQRTSSVVTRYALPHPARCGKARVSLVDLRQVIATIQKVFIAQLLTHRAVGPLEFGSAAARKRSANVEYGCSVGDRMFDNLPIQKIVGDGDAGTPTTSRRAERGPDLCDGAAALPRSLWPPA